MTDWGASGRRDTYSFSLVNPFTLRYVGKLNCEPEACSLTFGLYAENQAQGTITEVNDDFRRYGRDMLVRVNHTIEIPQEEPYNETLGTFFVDAVQRHSSLSVTRRRLSCYSTLWRLSQDFLPTDFSRISGSYVSEAMTSLVEDAGGIIALDEGEFSKTQFGNDIIFGVGENRLETLRTVAAWVGCDIGVDPQGRVTVTRYVEPMRKPVAFRFVDGSNCVYESGIDWESTRSDPVNRVVAFFTRESKPADEDESIPVSANVVAELPEEHQFSYAKAGRYRTEVLKVSDYCTEAELQERAERYLAENCGDVTYITIRHPRIPSVNIGSVVDYMNSVDDADPVNVRCQVVEQSISSLGAGCMTSSKLKVIKWRS